MEVLAGLDAWTTANKAVSAGLDGRLRDTVSVSYALLVPSSG